MFRRIEKDSFIHSLIPLLLCLKNLNSSFSFRSLNLSEIFTPMLRSWKPPNPTTTTSSQLLENPTSLTTTLFVGYHSLPLSFSTNPLGGRETRTNFTYTGTHLHKHICVPYMLMFIHYQIINRVGEGWHVIKLRVLAPSSLDKKTHEKKVVRGRPYSDILVAQPYQTINKVIKQVALKVNGLVVRVIPSI